MGYGPTAVPMDGGQTAKGTAEDPAYRMWTSADPSTLNHLNYADSVESDFLSLIAGSMISFDWKVDESGVGIGWEIKPEMLKELPYPVDEDGNRSAEFSGLESYKTQIDSYTTISDLISNSVFDYIIAILEDARDSQVDTFVNMIKTVLRI